MNAENAKKPGERDQPGDGEQKGEDAAPPPPPSWLERAATFLSCALIAFLIGVLVRDALNAHTPPAFTVVAGKPDVVGDSYRIPVKVYNTGDIAARTVMVHVELAGPDTVFVQTDLTLDWLPGKSSHSVIGYLKRPMDPSTVHAEVRGYSDP